MPQLPEQWFSDMHYVTHPAYGSSCLTAQLQNTVPGQLGLQSPKSVWARVFIVLFFKAGVVVTA